MESEIPRYCYDALLIISISEDYFYILDEDLHPFPDRRSLVHVIGIQCLGLLRRCVDGSRNRPPAARGYKCEDLNVTVNIPEASNGDQSAHRISGLFEDLLKDINLSFWPDGPGRWKFDIAGLKIAFTKLSIALEASLRDMQEGAQANQTPSVHALTNALVPLHI